MRPSDNFNFAPGINKVYVMLCYVMFNKVLTKPVAALFSKAARALELCSSNRELTPGVNFTCVSGRSYRSPGERSVAHWRKSCLCEVQHRGTFILRDLLAHIPTRSMLSFVSAAIRDGGWAAWQVGSCSVTCGSGIRPLARLCLNPAPNECGKFCPGPQSNFQQCTDLPSCCGRLMSVLFLVSLLTLYHPIPAAERRW